MHGFNLSLIFLIFWSDPYFEVDATQFESADAVVVMLGYSPMAYVIPHLPPNIRFLRPEGNLGLQDQDGLFKDIKILLEKQKDVIYILFSEDDKSVQIESSLARFGLDFQPENCFLLKTNTPDRLKICRLSY